jgi:Flp pilus assembly protein TadG
MNNPYHVSEKGQAIVFLVIGLVVFLGFVAMAIDGGMALADRRHVQNSADAGSLAGGGNAALSLEENDITNKIGIAHLKRFRMLKGSPLQLLLRGH